MRSLFLGFLLLLATASQSGASPAQSSALDVLVKLDYLTHLAATTCSQPGQTICSADCDQVILCLSDGEGGFWYVPLETCSSDTRCSAEQGSCVTGSSACGAPTGSGIPCNDVGFFPDPYNCTLYHLCLLAGSISEMFECEPGYAYNPLTADCSFQTTDPVCTEGPIPACTSVGQAGTVVANPSIFYVCTGTADHLLIPLLYKCHNGQVYDPTVYSCVQPTTPDTTPRPVTTQAAQ